MFNKHPKGLVAASLANLGERFGFYTMMAILVLFLQAKFALGGKEAGLIYSTFYFSIYILALVGGIIADKTRNYKGTILTGIVLMALGYLMLAIPSETPVANKTLMLTVTCVGLFVIAFGNGLFKGNLQALVGQMYDDPKYSSMRDSGFSLFYMFINIGAIFAPMAAVGVRNWWLAHNGYAYNADLPALCHGHLAGTLQPQAAETFQKLAAEVSNGTATDLTTFANSYLNVFSTGFHYAFGVAIVAMLVSLLIYVVNKSKFPDPSQKAAGNKAAAAAKHPFLFHAAARGYCPAAAAVLPHFSAAGGPEGVVPTHSCIVPDHYSINRDDFAYFCEYFAANPAISVPALPDPVQPALLQPKVWGHGSLPQNPEWYSRSRGRLR